MATNQLLKDYELLVPKKISEEATPYKLLKGAILTDSIKNVALTGSYGSGKSSIIESIKNDESIKSFENLSISLLNFSKEYLKIGEEKTIELEKRILQQIFYQKTSEELPLSKFHKIKKIDSKAIKINIFYLFAYVIVSFVLKERYGEILKSVIKTGKIESINILIWVLFVIYFMYSIHVFTNLLTGVYNLKLKKISSGKFLEVETKDEKDKSYLDLYMEDIIYCFEELNIKILYIEDLDRCNDIEIFIKLRELNNILNERLKNGKITFVYAVKDDLFSDKNRTKFFDFIIPIIPILNASNSEGYLSEKLKDDFKTPLEKNFLNEVFKYVTDMRLGINICNEYKIYREKFPKLKFSSTNLLAMIVFKNIYPRDFSEANFNKGFLYELFFIKKKKLIEEILIKHKIELNKIIEEHDCLIKKKKEQKIKNKSNLDMLIQSLAYAEILRMYKTVNILKTTNSKDSITIEYEYSNGSYSYWHSNKTIFLFNDLSKKIGIDYSEEINLINNVNEDKINKLSKDIKEKNDEINNIKYSSLKKLIDLLSEEKKQQILIELPSKEENTQASKEEVSEYEYSLKLFLFANGYINEFYRDYLSEFKEGELTIEDNTFIRDVHLNKKNEELKQRLIRTPKVVLEKLKIVNKYNLLNLNLIDFILKEKTEEFNKIKIMNIIDDNFNHFQDEFIFYLENLNKKREFILAIMKQRTTLWEDIITFYSKNEIKTILEYFIENLLWEDIDLLNESLKNKIIEYIENEDILAFNVSESKLENIFKNTLCKIKSINRIGNEKIYNVIKKYKNFVITKENIDNIYFWEFNKEISNGRYFSMINDLFFIDKIEENLELFLKEIYFHLDDFSKEDEDKLIILFENKIENNDLKNEFLNLNLNKFSELNKFLEENWNLLFDNNKIESTISNLNLYFSKNGLTDCLIKYFNINKDDIIKNTISNQKLLDELIEHEEIDFKIIQILLNQEYIYEWKKHKEIEVEKIKLLLNENKIKFSQELLGYLQDKEIFEKETKKFLLNFEDEIKELIENEETKLSVNKSSMSYLILKGKLINNLTQLLNILEIEELKLEEIIKILENPKVLKLKRSIDIPIENINKKIIEQLIKKDKINYFFNDLEFIFSLEKECIDIYIDIYISQILLDISNRSWNIKLPERLLLEYINSFKDPDIQMFKDQIKFYKDEIFKFFKLINSNFKNKMIHLDQRWLPIVKELEYFSLIKTHKPQNGKIVISIIRKEISSHVKDYLL